MVVLKSLGFFVRASLARLHEVRVNPFAHTFREASDVARRLDGGERLSVLAEEVAMVVCCGHTNQPRSVQPKWVWHQHHELFRRGRRRIRYVILIHAIS